MVRFQDAKLKDKSQSISHEPLIFTSNPKMKWLYKSTQERNYTTLIKQSQGNSKHVPHTL